MDWKWKRDQHCYKLPAAAPAFIILRTRSPPDTLSNPNTRLPATNSCNSTAASCSTRRSTSLYVVSLNLTGDSDGS
jgi:hypothetical protein